MGKVRAIVAAAIVASAIVASAASGGVAATPQDPIVGTWTNTQSKLQMKVVASGSIFVATRVTEQKIGPCTGPAGGKNWALSTGEDGVYVGMGYGYEWLGSDPASCKPLMFPQTKAWIGASDGKTISLKVCYSATHVTAEECKYYTRAEDASQLVAIATVSNGCGGAGWESVEKAQNYLGNTSVYRDSNVNPKANAYRVNFVEACNLHDAGYSGALVKDVINGGTVDFRRWSRAEVDKKFRDDMRTLCVRKIPGHAKVARQNCMSTGGNFSAGALSRYNFVRRWGMLFFDANLTEPGAQESGERLNN